MTLYSVPRQTPPAAVCSSAHNPARKPGRQQAMQQLISDIRRAMPLDEPYALLCQKQCVGCPKKLMEYLESELTGWESALQAGEQPSLGDVNQLAKTSRKIYRVLQKNGLTPIPDKTSEG